MTTVLSKSEAEAAFKLAGIPVLRTWELAHHYFPHREGESEEDTKREAVYRATHKSWLVKTPYGLIALLLRKRVIEIDWSDTTCKVIVTADDVTKADHYVHAYSLVKVAEYLSALRSKLEATKFDLGGALEDVVTAAINAANIGGLDDATQKACDRITAAFKGKP